MKGNVCDYINPLDIEDCAARFQAATPYRFFVIENFLRPEFAHAVCQAYPSYEEARRIGGEFKAVNEYRKVQITDAASFPEPVRILSEALVSQELCDTLTETTGIAELVGDREFRGGGMHLMDTGSRLDLHVDFNHLDERLYRRLNIVLYLNEDWNEKWGGALDIWDADLKTCAHMVSPVANRAVIFNTVPRSFHGVRPVNCPPNRSRNTFASFYYTEAVPPEWEGKHESTIWGYRPDEKARKYLKGEPARIGRAIPRALRRVKRAILDNDD